MTPSGSACDCHSTRTRPVIGRNGGFGIKRTTASRTSGGCWPYGHPGTEINSECCHGLDVKERRKPSILITPVVTLKDIGRPIAQQRPTISRLGGDSGDFANVSLLDCAPSCCYGAPAGACLRRDKLRNRSRRNTPRGGSGFRRWSAHLCCQSAGGRCAAAQRP